MEPQRKKVSSSNDASHQPKASQQSLSPSATNAKTDSQSARFEIPFDILHWHIGPYVHSSTARLVCRLWSEALPIRRLLVNAKKFDDPDRPLPSPWRVPIREIIVQNALGLNESFFRWFRDELCPLKKQNTLLVYGPRLLQKNISILENMIKLPNCTLSEIREYLPCPHPDNSFNVLRWGELLVGISENNSLASVNLNSLHRSAWQMSYDAPTFSAPLRRFSAPRLFTPKRWDSLSNLTHLKIGVSSLSESFCDALTASNSLLHLEITNDGSGDFVGPNLISALSKAVETHKGLRNFKMDQLWLQSGNLARFSEGLCSNTSLSFISVISPFFSANTIDYSNEADYGIILDLLQHKSSNLKSLEFQVLPFQLDPVDIFDPSPHIENLVLSYLAGCEVAADLLEAVSHMKTLKLLRVLPPGKKRVKIDALSRLSTFDRLESLEIETLRGGSCECLNHLAPLLRSTKTLTELRVSAHWGVDEEAQPFFQSISQNTTLKLLQLHGLRDLQLLRLGDALKKQTLLTDIYLGYYSHPALGWVPESLNNALEKMQQLQRLKFHGFYHRHAIEIVKATHRHLIELEIDSLYPEGVDWEGFTSAVASTSQLKSLAIIGCTISASTAVAIMETCKPLESFRFFVGQMTDDLNRAMLATSIDVDCRCAI